MKKIKNVHCAAPCRGGGTGGGQGGDQCEQQARGVAPQVEIGRFRYISQVKYPLRVADKASALESGRQGECPYGQSVSARRGKRYTEIGPLKPKLHS